MLKFNEDTDFFNSEHDFILNNYPTLTYKNEEGVLKLSGVFNFRAIYNEKIIEDSYKIEITFSNEYPAKVPVVKELDGKIEDEYHKNPDKSLCLGTPSALQLLFSQSPNIQHFINNILVPYLYRHSFLQRFGNEPFGEYAHGPLGIVQHYFELLKTQDLEVVVNTLSYVINKHYKGHHLCPCMSGRKLRNCHGVMINHLQKVPKEILIKEYDLINQYIDQLRNIIQNREDQNGMAG